MEKETWIECKMSLCNTSFLSSSSANVRMSSFHRFMNEWLNGLRSASAGRCTCLAFNVFMLYRYICALLYLVVRWIYLNYIISNVWFERAMNLQRKKTSVRYYDNGTSRLERVYFYINRKKYIPVDKHFIYIFNWQ